VGAGVEGVSGDNNTIRIGDNLPAGSGASACFIGGISGQTTANGTAVFIDADGKLGTITSSRRFKEDIKPIDGISEVIFSVHPVTFRYKKEIDPAGTFQCGLVAEEVAKADPNLVVRDKQGRPYSVRYDQVNIMLLNEFQKEHRKNEQQEATIAELRQQMATLTAGLQKVSAQLAAANGGIGMRSNMNESSRDTELPAAPSK
jgi:hypothetical protein